MQNAPSDFLAIERIPPLTYAFIFGQQGAGRQIVLGVRFTKP
jgi:hypothetical protein